MIVLEHITEMLLADGRWYTVDNVQIVPTAFGWQDEKQIDFSSYSRPNESMFQFRDHYGEISYCPVNSVKGFRLTNPSGG